MVGVIDGFRWSLLGGHAPLDAGNLALSLGVTVALAAIGVAYFRRMERRFADVI
jgi:lipopolysaccharide transport system permease protein